VVGVVDQTVRLMSECLTVAVNVKANVRMLDCCGECWAVAVNVGASAALTNDLLKSPAYRWANF
jgi:hypothetical protein